jgi:copper(I)-binding protein
MNWELRSVISSLIVPLVLSNTVQASGGPVDHINPPTELVVEHAELAMAGSDGDQVEGYVTIWNGTNVQASLASIESEAFGTIKILQTDFRTGETSVAAGIVQIPGHAELTMRRGGIRLALKNPVTPLDILDDARLTLVFDDGKELEVTATIIRDGGTPTVHRHGEGDRNVN